MPYLDKEGQHLDTLYSAPIFTELDNKLFQLHLLRICVHELLFWGLHL